MGGVSGLNRSARNSSPGIVCPPEKRPPRRARGTGLQGFSGKISLGPEAHKPLSLRRNFSWVVAGNVVHAISRWGMVVVLAQIGNVEMIGQIVLAAAICAPVNSLANLGLRGVLITDAKGEYRFQDYLGLRLITSVLALLVVAGILLATGCETETALIILIVAVARLFESISDIFHAHLQRHERMDRIAIALMIRGPLSLVLLAVGVYLTKSLLWGVVGFSLAMAITFFCYDLPNGSRITKALLARGESPSGATTRSISLKPEWNVSTLVRLMWLSLPMGFVMLTISLNANIPRYMIDHYVGSYDLGVFASIAYLGFAGTMVVTAVGQSASPRLAKYHASGDTAAYCRLVWQLLGINAFIGIGIILLMALAGGPILGLLYGSDFVQYADLTVFLLLPVAVMYLASPLARAVDAMRRFKIHMLIQCMSVAVLLLFLPGLIQSHGLKGAALAMLINAVLSLLAYGGTVFLSLRWLDKAVVKQVNQTQALSAR